MQEAGLGTITTLQFLDLPADQPAMVESFLEKTRGEVNPVQLALLRWQLQAQLFKVISGHVTPDTGLHPGYFAGRSCEMTTPTF